MFTALFTMGFLPFILLIVSLLSTPTLSSPYPDIAARQDDPAQPDPQAPSRSIITTTVYSLAHIPMVTATVSGTLRTGIVPVRIPYTTVLTIIISPDPSPDATTTTTRSRFFDPPDITSITRIPNPTTGGDLTGTRVTNSNPGVTRTITMDPDVTFQVPSDGPGVWNGDGEKKKKKKDDSNFGSWFVGTVVGGTLVVLIVGYAAVKYRDRRRRKRKMMNKEGASRLASGGAREKEDEAWTVHVEDHEEGVGVEEAPPPPYAAVVGSGGDGGQCRGV